MKTELILVGKTTDSLFAKAIADYAGRIAHYIPFAITTLPELKNTRKLSAEQQCTMEGELILRQLQPSDTRLVFVIGGPYGFSPAVYQRANEQLSLSRMTFSHQMVRLIFVEQLYRACTIIKGEPYHHE